ncbi:MAG: hypothetical protein RBU45_20105 [Myxococcota bacterium]|nr:hypothetical protein [Myxococcota bacterium]
MTQPTPTDLLALLREVFQETLADRDLPADDASLLGADAPLDSMELVAFVADVEEAAQARYGQPVILADERAMSRSKSPFRNLTSLAEYLGELLGEAGPA